MPFETGTLILANYSAKVKDTGEAVESTQADEAKKLGIHDPTRRYEPKLISIGEGWVLQGLDEALRNATVAERLTVEVPPEKGFGQRDASLVRLLPLRKFGERANELRVGDVVEVEGRLGVVRFLGSGRAQVDFNHRFAGKTLIYDIEVLTKLETDQDKIMAMIKRRMAVDAEKVKLTFDGPSLQIELPEDSYLTEGIQILKKAIATDVFKYLPGIRAANFVESYQAPPPKETEAPEAAPAKPAPEEAPVAEPAKTPS